MLSCAINAYYLDNHQLQSRLAATVTWDGETIHIQPGPMNHQPLNWLTDPIPRPGGGTPLTVADGEAFIRALPLHFSGVAIRADSVIET